MTLHDKYIELRDLLLDFVDEDKIDGDDYTKIRDILLGAAAELAEQGIKVDEIPEYDDLFCSGWQWDEETGLPTPHGHYWAVTQ